MNIKFFPKLLQQLKNGYVRTNDSCIRPVDIIIDFPSSLILPALFCYVALLSSQCNSYGVLVDQ